MFRYTAILTLLAGAAVSAQTPQFQRLPRMTAAGPNIRAFSAASGDVDGNGTIDVVIANFSAPVGTQLMLNDGDGNFANRSNQLPSTTRFAGAVALIDVDGDNDLDIVLGGTRAAGVDLWLNNGAGIFAATTGRMPNATDQTYEFAVVDIDFDGDMDLVCANFRGTLNRLYINDGTGTFTDRTTAQMPGGGVGAWGLLAQDLDGDVDIDIIFLSATPQILINTNFTGSYRNETASRLPTMQGNPRKTVAGDFDKDGDIDIYLSFFNTQDELLLNDGSGKFTIATTTHLPTGLIATYDVEAVDFDRDGDLDLYVGTWAQNGTQNFLLLNDGTGRFTNAANRHYVGDDATTVTTTGDYDGDGDIDVYLGNWNGPDHVAFNTHRHIYPPAQPEIGQNWLLEVTSAPGYAPNLSIVRNAISVRRLPSRVALPGIGGLLAIDPSVMVFIPSTIVNQGIGQATISVAIPNNAQLRGVSFEVQSLFTQVGLGEGFSNAWTETVR